jgi:4'-phosphopantetheinyl transferase EntD
MLTGLFPQGVVAAELRGPVDASSLHPQERHACDKFTSKRLEEFTAGRACARRALAEFGMVGVPLPVDSDRRPRWPRFLVGSITHTTGFCGAAVAGRNQFKAIGLDAEHIAHVTRAVWSQICTADEARFLKSRPRREQAKIAAITFSAKEAFYKCQYGVTGGWLDFHDLAVEIDSEDETCGIFTIRLLSEEASAVLKISSPKGRFRIAGELVFTGVALEATAWEEDASGSSGWIARTR